MDVEDFKKKYEQLKDNPMYKNFCSILDTKSQVLERTAKENQELKQKLNWVAFGDDPELSLRYLRKIGYVDFDEERKVYINKHNNEPFLLKDEQEKDYYIKDEELNEYTTQLEYKVKELKKQLTKKDGLIKDLSFAVDDLEKHYKTHQKKFIEYLEDRIKFWKDKIFENSLTEDNFTLALWRSRLITYEEVLNKIEKR